jgi:hypothetical protein
LGRAYIDSSKQDKLVRETQNRPHRSMLHT